MPWIEPSRAHFETTAMDYIAHIKKPDENLFSIQSLEDHLKGTAELAADFAAKFHNKTWGEIIGLWHDIENCN